MRAEKTGIPACPAKSMWVVRQPHPLPAGKPASGGQSSAGTLLSFIPKADRNLLGCAHSSSRKMQFLPVVLFLSLLPLHRCRNTEHIPLKNERKSFCLPNILWNTVPLEQSSHLKRVRQAGLTRQGAAACGHLPLRAEAPMDASASRYSSRSSSVLPFSQQFR